MRGYNAKLIDEEYRRKKMYQKREREICKDRDCNKCKYQDICLEGEEGGNNGEGEENR